MYIFIVISSSYFNKYNFSIVFPNFITVRKIGTWQLKASDLADRANYKFSGNSLSNLK